MPKAKYLELEWNENNLVLSCFSCSNIKGNFDVLNTAGQKLLEISEEYKNVLIHKIMSELSKRIQTMENERIE